MILSRISRPLWLESVIDTFCSIFLEKPDQKEESNRSLIKVVRAFNEKLLNILKTETEIEKKLKNSTEYRAEFMDEMIANSQKKDAETYRRFHDKIAIGRMMRYVSWPMHKNNMIQTSYVVNGSLKMRIGDQVIEVKAGEFIIPGQDTLVSTEKLGEDDIVINFLMRPEFLEEMLIKLSNDNQLREFLMDSLRKNTRFNSYIHFKGIEDLAVFNLAETLIYAAFPYIDDENIMDGACPDPQITATVITAMYLALGRNLSAAVADKASDPQRELKERVEEYIEHHYRDASLSALAKEMKQSKSSLSRQVSKAFGMTFKELLLKRRFEQAGQLLRNARLSVFEVAVSVGYENTSFFYRKFKERYGISPNAYRRLYGIK